ncbi:MAG: ATP-binding cassette domain-containing protein [Clostridia bacterium]|nr:ATP-binding cassette domain-containing protein [Clostridia bacterium]
MIKVTNLTKKYGNHTAVNSISFEVGENMVLGFLGPNGAGKTTTMNMVTGYIASSDGEILINGHDILREPIEAKKCIGYLPEHPPLYSDMLVCEYLEFVYELKKIKGKNKKEHLEEVMEKVGLTHVKDRVIKNLSKGYQQRVGFAQALVGDPKILILDEPTVGLDPNQIVEIRNVIRELGKEHTVVFSSHILPEIRAVCDHIIIINKGEIVATGETEALLNEAGKSNLLRLVTVEKAEQVLKSVSGVEEFSVVSEKEEEYVYQLTLSEHTNVKDLSVALSKAGIVVTEMHKNETSLEQLFAQLTAEVKEDETNESDI